MPLYVYNNFFLFHVRVHTFLISVFVLFVVVCFITLLIHPISSARWPNEFAFIVNLWANVLILSECSCLRVHYELFLPLGVYLLMHIMEWISCLTIYSIWLFVRQLWQINIPVTSYWNAFFNAQMVSRQPLSHPFSHPFYLSHHFPFPLIIYISYWYQ